MYKQFSQKLNEYPPSVRKKFDAVRKLIHQVAKEIDSFDTLAETIKWGEPSFVVKGGSPLRVDWKKNEPSQYFVYFNCQTNLVDTFKQIYPGTFKYDGKRAIIFQLNDEVPLLEFKHCIKLALTYHKVKHLPLLGA